MYKTMQMTFTCIGEVDSRVFEDTKANIERFMEKNRYNHTSENLQSLIHLFQEKGMQIKTKVEEYKEGSDA